MSTKRNNFAYAVGLITFVIVTIFMTQVFFYLKLFTAHVYVLTLISLSIGLLAGFLVRDAVNRSNS
jgi:hypothetical protein